MGNVGDKEFGDKAFSGKTKKLHFNKSLWNSTSHSTLNFNLMPGRSVRSGT